MNPLDLLVILLVDCFVVSPIHEMGHFVAAIRTHIPVEEAQFTPIKRSYPYFGEPHITPSKGISKRDRAFVSAFGLLATIPILFASLLAVRADAHLAVIVTFLIGLEFFGSTADFIRVTGYYLTTHFPKTQHLNELLGLLLMFLLGLTFIGIAQGLF